MRPATVVYRDPTLPHQIIIAAVFGTRTWPLSVSCNCRVRAGLPPLGTRERWEPAEALAAYRAHLPVGVTV